MGGSDHSLLGLPHAGAPHTVLAFERGKRGKGGLSPSSVPESPIPGRWFVSIVVCAFVPSRSVAVCYAFWSGIWARLEGFGCSPGVELGDSLAMSLAFVFKL